MTDKELAEFLVNANFQLPEDHEDIERIIVNEVHSCSKEDFLEALEWMKL